MKNKVILISVDGMRPDGLLACGNPYTEVLMRECSYTLKGKTVFPSITLPCHYSMAHSITPQRHGILNNTYMTPVRPVRGIFERVLDAGGVSCMFYGWEHMRDIAHPGALKYATYINAYANELNDDALTHEAIARIEKSKPDFAFLYLVDTDDKGGHDSGWMTEEYLYRISLAVSNIRRVIKLFGDEYSIIIMADHGGHDRIHGTDMPEDMTVPFFFRGPDFEAGRVLEDVSILDIAPTIAKLTGASASPEWEGKALF